MTYEHSLAALADPTRRQIFERLRSGPATVQKLADDLPVSRPAVSQHLKTLRDAGLVHVEPQGSARLYSIHTPGLRALRDWIDGFWGDALESFKNYSEKEQ
jgi:DNA-binding transcriptional ArsR family regulator